MIIKLGKYRVVIEGVDGEAYTPTIAEIINQLSPLGSQQRCTELAALRGSVQKELEEASAEFKRVVRG